MDTKYDQILDVLDDPCWSLLKSKVELPTVVVVGAQSSGKSSCLSEILGIPFPVNDDMCTKFVTKLVSRRKANTALSVEIHEEVRLDTGGVQIITKPFKTSIRDPRRLDEVINAVGLRLGTDQTLNFHSSVLEVHLQSPDCPSMTLVDVPGLIDIPMSTDQTHADVEFIKNTVVKYLRSDRTLVIMVVDSSKDISGHTILRYITENNASDRTIGVLTKPDLLAAQGPNVRERYLELVTNQNALYRLPLGWYILRNRTHDESHLSPQQRDENEKLLLEHPTFATVPGTQKGVKNYRNGIGSQVQRFYHAGVEPLYRDTLQEMKTLEAHLASLPPKLDSTRQRAALSSILEDISQLLERAIPRAGSAFGPKAATSWLPEPTDLQQQLDLHDTKLSSKLEGGSNSDNISLLQGRAEELLQKFPPQLGSFPIVAAKNLFLEETNLWAGVFDSHASDVCRLISDHIARHVDHEVSEHYRANISRLLVQPAIGTLRIRLLQQLPAWITADQSSADIQGVHFASSVIETSRRNRQKHLGQLITRAISQTFHVQTDQHGRLPQLDGSQLGVFHLEDLRNALEQGVQNRAIEAAEVVEAVTEQVQFTLRQLVNSWSLRAYTEPVDGLKTMLSSKSVLQLSDKQVSEIMELPAETREEVETVMAQCEACRHALGRLSTVRQI